MLVPFELRPGIPLEGWSAKEHGLEHAEHVDEHLRRVAREGAFPLVLPDHLPNTHLALTLGELARDAGEERHTATHRAIFGARYGRGRDIGSRDVLLDIATSQGFDTRDVERAWDEPSYDQRLGQFRNLARYLGIAATPAALVCNELIIGSRPYQVLTEALDRCMVTPESVAEES